MVDEEIKDVPTGPAGAPVNRDARREPDVIEGEIAARETDESSPDSIAAESRAEPRPAPPARSRNDGFLSGALAGLIVSALGLGAGYMLFAPRGDVSETAARLGEVEAQAQRDRSALTAVAGLDKRVAALEAASAGNGAVSEATQRLAAEAKDLRTDVDAEKGAIPELSARVAKLETDTQKPSGVGPDAAALADRIDKVEAALAAPKTETRAAAEKPAAADNAATIAIIAEVADERLRSGAGLASELTALGRLGVDAAALAPLQAVANGAPTNSALAASFSAVAPRVLAATSKAETGSVSDRFLAHLHSLVKVRELNETAGDDPPALVSQIEAASGRGDIGAALASFDKLPEAARKAAGDWPTLARARQAADTALQAIREAAIGRLAGPNP